VCELRDDVPALGRGGALKRYGQKVFNRRGTGNFVWPNGNRLTRTYVDSRKFALTRIHRESP
jgi:hypothetical protein